MSDRYFLDTNILVYTFDGTAGTKCRKAQALVEDALVKRVGVISSQVVQEFLHVATRKFDVPLAPGEARSFLDAVLLPLCEVYPTPRLYQEALTMKQETGYSFYDCLIVAAALEARCRVLMSEDLQDGRKIGALTICNPFVA